MDGDNPDEDFPPTSGRAFGVIALVFGAGFAVFELVDRNEISWPVVAFGVLVCVLAWVALLRPRVSIVGDELKLRAMVSTTWLPLGALDDVVVRQFLIVSVAGKRYTSPAVGRTRRAIHKDGGLSVAPEKDERILDEGQSFALFVEQRIRERAQRVRDLHGIELGSAEQDELARGVRRQLAVPETVALVAALVAFVVLLVR